MGYRRKRGAVEFPCVTSPVVLTPIVTGDCLVFFCTTIGNAIWQISLLSNETAESMSYPERPGEPDCSYYIRTAVCRFGSNCRFNHPSNRKLAIANERMMGEYPERIGLPECQNEVECAYYLRTEQCKFGSTCKFHHPQPTNMMVSLLGSPVYSPTTPVQQSIASANWSRASYITIPQWQSPSSYTPLILPPAMASIPVWNTYRGQPGSTLSPDSQLQVLGKGQIMYGSSGQSESLSAGSPGAFSPYNSSSVPVGFYSLPRDNIFPARLGQSEWRFYMKTGDCNFGAVCSFHHPRERLLPAPYCILSPIGLPLRRLEEPLCIVYFRYGICKFGPSCKFDHPMGVLNNLSPSTSSDVPVRRSLASASVTITLPLSAEGLVESFSAKTRRLTLSDTRQMPSSDVTIEPEE